MVSIGRASVRRVLVTGASGFVGRALCSALLARGYTVLAAVRSATSMPSVAGLDTVVIGDVCAQTDWSQALEGVDCIIHCAARAHVMFETGKDALEAYRTVNVKGTQRLAVQAAALGVRRLVFLSSIKVNGERTTDSAPFLFSDEPAPEDPYGVSKWEAEQALWAVSEQTGLRVVVVRAPLVYGPGVKGNLLRLLRLVARGVPLPLAESNNQRSYLGLFNLVDLLLHCVEHSAAGQTFLASDGQDLSTPQLIQLMAEGMNRPAILLPVPLTLLKAVGFVLGRGGEIDRLVGSLQVDSGYTQEQLGWIPPMSVKDGVREMARWYASWQDAEM
jgi:nucleoside-diphosphate-sugar epimerase